MCFTFKWSLKLLVNIKGCSSLGHKGKYVSQMFVHKQNQSVGCNVIPEKIEILFYYFIFILVVLFSRYFSHSVSNKVCNMTESIQKTNYCFSTWLKKSGHMLCSCLQKNENKKMFWNGNLNEHLSKTMLHFNLLQNKKCYIIGTFSWTNIKIHQHPIEFIQDFQFAICSKVHSFNSSSSYCN